MRWRAYFQKRPIDTAEAQLALLMSMLAKDAEMEDFMLSYPKQTEAVLDGQDLDNALSLMFGGGN